MDKNLLYENRYKQFLDVLKTHLFELVIVSTYTFILSLPLLLFLAFVSLTTFFSERHIMNVLLINGIITILLPISGLGFAGTSYFIKKILFNEGASVNSDFYLGIKKNGKEFAITFFLIGLSYLLLQTSLFNISYLEYEPIVLIFLCGLSYVLFFLILFSLIFTCTQIVLYKDRFSKLFTNGLRFTFGTLYKTLFIFLLGLLPFIIYEFIPFLIVKIIAIIIGGLFYIGFASLLFQVYSNHIFDEYINKKQFPEIYKKGLIKNESDTINME